MASAEGDVIMGFSVLGRSPQRSIQGKSPWSEGAKVLLELKTYELSDAQRKQHSHDSANWRVKLQNWPTPSSIEHVRFPRIRGRTSGKSGVNMSVMSSQFTPWRRDVAGDFCSHPY